MYKQCDLAMVLIRIIFKTEYIIATVLITPICSTIMTQSQKIEIRCKETSKFLCFTKTKFHIFSSAWQRLQVYQVLSSFIHYFIRQLKTFQGFLITDIGL